MVGNMDEGLSTDWRGSLGDLEGIYGAEEIYSYFFLLQCLCVEPPTGSFIHH